MRIQLVRITILVLVLGLVAGVPLFGGIPIAAAATLHAPFAAVPMVYTKTYRTPGDLAQCAALIKGRPQLATNAQGCNFVVIEKVSVKQAAPVRSMTPYVLVGPDCTPYNPKADIEIDVNTYESYRLSEAEQETEFLGDGCLPLRSAETARLV